MTEAAANEVRSLVAQQDRDDLALRVYVSGGGCSGLQYGMALDENIEPGDEVFEVSGVTLRRGQHMPALPDRLGRRLYHD